MEETLVGWVWGLRLGVLDSGFRHPELESTKGYTQTNSSRNAEGPSLKPNNTAEEGAEGAVTNQEKTHRVFINKAQGHIRYSSSLKELAGEMISPVS